MPNIDRASPVPYYVQLYDLLLRMIQDGELEPGRRLPGESELHRDFAYLYGWLTPILVLLATVAGLSRRVLLMTVALLALYAIQTYLPTISDALPRIASLHAINALLVFWLAVQVARSVPWVPGAVGTAGR